MNNFDDLLNNAPAETQPQLSNPGSPRNEVSWGGKEDWVAKKQAERDAVFELSDTTALEVAGDGGRFKQYLDVQATFSRYSAVNTLLIMAQKPEATRLADFDSWKAQGGNVKPGQKGISILEPHEYIKEDGSPGTGYNIKKVFDVSQVDTRKVKAKPTPSYNERQILAALVKSAPIPIIGIENLPDNLGTIRHENRVEVKKGMGFDDTFRCLARELCAHHLENGPDMPENAEFSAYSAAYVLCKKHGVDTRGFDFADAPTVMAELDSQQVKGELAGIRDCADDISGSMARQLGAQDKAARNQEAR